MILSVVATSRNDDHGGNLHTRMQYFTNGFIEQCKRHNLRAELILVEWNPPEDTLPLSEALELPKDKEPCEVRIISVPKKIHDTLNHSKGLPLFQMIAKNVGIRRAKGKYVLATNIDILFPDSLIEYLRDHLKPGYCYRTNRLDVPANLPKLDSINTLLDYCKNNYFRIHGRNGTKVRAKKEWAFIDSNSSTPTQSKFKFWLRKLCIPKRVDLPHLFRRIKYRFLFNVHTNACGDFTLLSSKDWNALQGYPEIHGFSWHLDSLLIYQACLQGIGEKELTFENSIYHIEHDQGSGYTPENPDLVFERIKIKNIPYLDDQGLLKMVSLMKKKRKKNESFAYNDNNWGLADYEFQESLL